MSARNRVLPILAALAVLSATPQSARAQQSAEARLQAAIYKQQVEGDVRGAIALLGRIAAENGENRSVAAQALLHLGFAHESLGSDAAEEAYRRLIRDYPDQEEPARAARERLAVLAPAEPGADDDGTTARRLWVSRCCAIHPGAISPDGRELAVSDFGLTIQGDNTGDLVVVRPNRDEARIVGITGGQQEDGDTYVLRSVWSRDGSRLAFAAWPKGWGRMVLRVVDADGTNDRVISDNPQHAHLRPGAWTSDERLVVTLIVGWDEVVKLGTIGVEDGSVSILKTLRSGLDINDMSLSLSPDDRFLAYAYAPSTTEPADVYVLAMDGSGEWIVAPSAAAEASPHWTPDGERLVFVSDRSGSTGLWAVEMRGGQAAGEPELVRPYTGPILPLGFTAAGALAYSTEIPEADLRVRTIDWEAGGRTVDDEPLTERYVGYNHVPAWSPDGRRVAFVSTRPGPGLAGSNVLVIRSLVDGTERDIDLPMPLGREGELRAIRPEWSADSRQVLLQAYHAEASEAGVDLRRAAYRIDAESDAVERDPYIRDYAGLSGGGDHHFVDERQSRALRSLGVRITGQWDHTAYRLDDEPLRPGESLLQVANGIRWWRAFNCDDAASRPEWTCMGGNLKEGVTPAADSLLLMSWELSPDGGTVAYIQENVDRPGAGLWVWPISEDSRPRRLVGGLPDVGSVRWTPDGRSLLYTRSDGDDTFPVYRISIDGGEPERLEISLRPRELGGLTFAPDGRRVIVPVRHFTRDEIWLLSGFPWDHRD